MSHRFFKSCITFILLLSMGLCLIDPMLVSAKSAEKTELTILCNQSEVDMAQYKERFEAENPGVELVYIYSPDYEEEAMKAISSENYADVLFIPGGLNSKDYPKYLEPFGDMGTLSKVYNYMDSSAQCNNLVYGIPASCYMSGFLYNKAVFEQAGIMAPPKDMDSFIQALQQIKDHTDAIPFYTNYNSAWALSEWEKFPFFEMTGDVNYKYGDFIYETNPYTFDSTHGKVYSLLYDIIDQKLCEPELGCYEWDNTKKMMNDGEIACMAIGSWAVSQFKNAGKHADDISFMAFPNAVGGKQCATIVADYCYGINVHSEQKELARKYVDFMLNDSMYAIDHDTISVAQTDPLPKSYTNMDDIVLSFDNFDSYDSVEDFKMLDSQLHLEDGKEQIRVMNAAAHKDSDETLEIIFSDWNKRWESSRSSDMQKENIVYDYFDGIILDQEKEVKFSDKEKEYLDAIDSIKVGYLASFAPFTFTENGQFKGVVQALFDEVYQITEKEITYIPYTSYKDLYDAVLAGEIDVVAAIENNNFYASKLALTKAVFTFNNVIVKGKNVSLDDYSAKRISYQRDSEYYYLSSLDHVVEAANVSDSLMQVNKNLADYMVTNYYTANYYMNANDLTNLAYVTMSSKTDLCIALKPSADLRAISIINKCLFALTDAQMEGLLVNSMDPPAQKITLFTLIKVYPVASIGVIAFLFLIIILVITYIYRVRNNNMKRLTIEAQRYQVLADLSNEYLFEYDIRTNRMSFEKKYVKDFSFPTEVYLEQWDEMISDNMPAIQAFMAAFEEIKDLCNSHEKNFVLPFADKNDWYKMILFTVDDEKGEAIHIIGKIVNIQQDIDRQSKLIKKAERDNLTGILNRDGFQSVCEQLMNAEAFPEYYCYAVLDMDNFKGINDLFGHAGGDIALKLLADTLSECFDQNGIVSRFGGDEFIVLLTETLTIDQTNEELDRFVKKMHQIFRYDGKEREISVSLGAVWVSQEVSFEEAFKLADEQLYQVKQKGKNSFILAEPTIS